MAAQTITMQANFPAPKRPLSGAVNASLYHYVSPADGAAPYNHAGYSPKGELLEHNYSKVAHIVTINDLRGREDAYKVATHGFQPLPANAVASIATTARVDFDSDESIQRHYYPEIERILLQNLDGTPERVFIFDHTVRKVASTEHRKPVLQAHVDQIPCSAVARVRQHMGEEAETLLKARFRLVNVWSPINGTVESFPLAVADSNTLSDEHLVTIERRGPDKTRYTASAKYDPGTKWYYWSGMRNNERLLLQCYDSIKGGLRTPHTAFEDPRSGENAKPRQSIEVRALIFG